MHMAGGVDPSNRAAAQHPARQRRTLPKPSPPAPRTRGTARTCPAPHWLPWPRRLPAISARLPSSPAHLPKTCARLPSRSPAPPRGKCVVSNRKSLGASLQSRLHLERLLRCSSRQTSSLELRHADRRLPYRELEWEWMAPPGWLRQQAHQMTLHAMRACSSSSNRGVHRGYQQGRHR